MILVIGGAFAGKTEYIKTHFGEDVQVINAYHLQIKEQLKEGLEPLVEAKKLLDQAKTADAAGQSPAQTADRLVIVCDEVGYGLVPVDAFERAYREKVGRVCCYLAQEAEQVIRVVCGVGSRIK